MHYQLSVFPQMNSELRSRDAGEPRNVGLSPPHSAAPDSNFGEFSVSYMVGGISATLLFFSIRTRPSES